MTACDASSITGHRPDRPDRGWARRRSGTPCGSERSAIGRIARFDPTLVRRARSAGEVRDDAATTSPSRSTEAPHDDARHAAGPGRAAELAMSRRAPCPVRPSRRTRLGVAVGTALGGWTDARAAGRDPARTRRAARQSVHRRPAPPNHGPGVEVATAVGAQGPQCTFSSGCPASLQAIAHGADPRSSPAIVDVCLAGGTESPLSFRWRSRHGPHERARAPNDDPAACLRPFDARTPAWC